jgi:cobalt-zinc-cadmium resistance protein CzcA
VIDPLQLEKYSLGIENISNAIVANNQNTGGSFVVIGSSQMNIRGIGRITKVEDIGNIIVENRGGIPILVKDIATIEMGVLPPTGVVGYFDKDRGVHVREGIEGIVLLRKNKNPSKTVFNLLDKIDELNSEILPPDIRVVPFYDRTELVSLTLKTVAKTLIEGTVVVLTLLTLLLGNWRAGIVAALAIPFSLLFAFTFMYISNIPANLLSLGAIDFGVLVDASIVMIEGIIRKLNIDSKGNLKTLISDTANEVKTQILFSVGMIILALFPILSLQRVEGKLFAPMAWTLSFAILGSLVYSLIGAPVVASLLFKKFVSKETKLWKYPERYYKSFLEKRILNPYQTVKVGGGVLLVLCLFGFFLGSEFLPELDEGAVWIRIKLPAGISLQHAGEYPEKLRKEIVKFTEVRSVITQLGRNDTGTDPFGPNRIEILVQLHHPYSSWESGRTKKEFIKEINKLLGNQLPGASYSISQPILDNTTETINGSSADMAVFLNGKNLTQIREIAKQILEIIKSMDGASEYSIEQENKQAQIRVEVDREKSARYGINVSDVNRIIEVGMGGLPISYLYEEERKFAIIIRFTKESRNTVERISKIIIPAKGGQRVPISQIARVYYEDGETIISRWDGLRMLTVKTNVRDRDQGSFASELEKRIKKEIKFPEDVEYDLGGQFENLERARKRLFMVIPLTLVLIFVALVIYFGDDRTSAILVLANIPFSVAGGIIGLLLRGINFSISAGVGFVSLFGISLMSGILLVSELNYLRKKYPEKDLAEIVLTGSITQFKPRFLVMIVAILGLLPAALNTGVGSDIQRPMATVIVGGLFSSLFLGLTVSPSLYIVFNQLRDRWKKVEVVDDV